MTLAGDRFVSRMASSYIAAVGLEELIAATPDDYVRRAVELAGDLPRLAGLRRRPARASRTLPALRRTGLYARARSGVPPDVALVVPRAVIMTMQCTSTRLRSCAARTGSTK